MNPAQKKIIGLFLVLAIANTSLVNGRNKINESNQSEKMEKIQLNFDQLRKTNWTDQETKNAALCLDFVQSLMNDHDFDYVRKTFGNDQYKQHNRAIPDGVDGLVDYVQEFAKKYNEYTYDVKHIYTDGDYVTFHSHATIKSKHRGDDTKGVNVMDTWKIEDGKIVEHWDALQPMDGSMRLFVWLNGGKIKNQNGVY